MQQGDDFFVLDRNQAMGCAEYVDSMREISKEALKKGFEPPEEFFKDINGLYDFLVLLINTGIQNIEIPDRYKEMYIALSFSAFFEDKLN